MNMRRMRGEVSIMLLIPIIRLFLSILILFVLIASPAFAEEYANSFQIIHHGPGLSLHKEMISLPYTYSSEYHGNRSEAVFQISAKHSFFGSRFYFAYTQISFWQAYDHYNSAPFRETNYNPEIFYRTVRIAFLSGLVGADLGAEHESNGQTPPESRSWNLIYVCPSYQISNMLFYLKLRYRISENDKEYPGAAVGDDNPDITDFLGYNDLHFYYHFWKRHTIHAMIRGNLNKGKGGVNLNYSLPLPFSDVSFIVIRFSQGYGESLVDYNKSLTRFGVGIMFSE